MRSPSRPVAAALTLTATLLLSGCLAPAPAITPLPEASASPLFATDEEALAAATEAYESYLAMSDLIGSEGGSAPERIARFVGEGALPEQVAQFAPYREQQLKISGRSTFDRAELQQVAEVEHGIFEIGIYLCLDVSNVRVIDSTGRDVTQDSRKARLPLEVGFESERSSGSLVLVSSESWRGADFC